MSDELTPLLFLHTWLKTVDTNIGSSEIITLREEAVKRQLQLAASRVSIIHLGAEGRNSIRFGTIFDLGEIGKFDIEREFRTKGLPGGKVEGKAKRIRLRYKTPTIGPIMGYASAELQQDKVGKIKPGEVKYSFGLTIKGKRVLFQQL